MDFPKFDGTGVRVWIDNCETYFAFYQIAEGFMVSATALHLVGDAANWYQVWKLEVGWHDWTMLKMAIAGEFEVNLRSLKMDELILLTQTGTVTEYRSKFNQLVYQIRLYDPSLSGSGLINHFVLGLKDELRSFVQAVHPTSITQAYLVALAHEGAQLGNVGKRHFQKRDPVVWKQPEKPKLATGELWKAQQLKEYRRAHDLCFKCGDKYVPGHVCVKPDNAQLKAMEVQEDQVILSDDNLDAVVASDMVEDDCNLSLHAMAGTCSASTLQLRAMVGNQVILILVDSGSSHSFVTADLCTRLQLHPVSTVPISVKVANGELLSCEATVP